jgi:hypothetical protein
MTPTEEKKFHLKRFAGIIIALATVLLVELLFHTS